jgi:hypothetical protein
VFGDDRLDQQDSLRQWTRIERGERLVYKANDNKLVKRKLREPDGWKDSAGGKTHVKRQRAFTA